ncbi:MAG TPA: iron uptake porin [Leptolyngbyaceae cyanobacterium]
MSKTLWNALKLSPAILGATILVSHASVATEDASRTIAQEPTIAATDSSPAGLSSNQPDLEALNSVTTVASLESDKLSPNITNSSVLAQLSDATDEASTTVGQQTNTTLDRIEQYSQQSTESTDSLGQVTSVSQLRDVQPTDWAFQALQSLVERYGCIEGYPDRTYRGNRAMTRYEFAAGLNACLDRIRELIEASRPTPGGGGITEQDLEQLRRLQEEFRSELATLRGRVDTLEARTARLEAQQFSTTTKLRGEAIFALASVFGDERAGGGDLQDNVIFADRVRLNLDSSFTGKDRLRTRLQARNVTQFSGGVTGTNMTRLSFDGNDDNNVTLHRLEYRFPIGSKTNVYIDAIGGEYNDNMYTFNPLFESSGQGSVSRFGRFNPIYRQTAEGTGITVDHNFSKAFGITLGYQVPRDQGNDPTEGLGLFNGAYSALAQLAIRPSKNVDFGFTYVRSLYKDGAVSVSSGTGSTFANNPFAGEATSADHFGLQGSFRLSRYFVISGWGGYTRAYQESNGDADATIINYAVTLGFPDLGKKGNLLGFVAGQPPKATDNNYFVDREDDDTSYHLEAFYRIQVNNNISITPGAFVILNPEHNDNNDAIYVGTLRTTFTF